MALTDFLDRLTLTRRLVKALERLADAQEVQCLLLERIANQVSPPTPDVSPEDLRQTGPAFRNEGQLARLEEWKDDFVEKFHREPTEEELLAWVSEDSERVQA